MNIKSVKSLRTLDKIATIGVPGCGIAQQRIYKPDCNVNFIGGCIEQCANCIQLLNYELPLFQSGEYRFNDIICLVVEMAWIHEAFTCIRQNISESAMKVVGSNSNMQRINEFVNAARSFIVAHPLNTTRHEKLGLDGNYICVSIHDVRRNAFLQAFGDTIEFEKLSFDGIKPCNNIYDEDFCLIVYSNSIDQMKYKRHIGCTFSDFYEAAAAYIDRLYEIDRGLRRAARKHEI